MIRVAQVVRDALHLTGDIEHPVQARLADVHADHHHPLAQVSQAHRQVASNERLALARLRGAEKDHTLVLA